MGIINFYFIDNLMSKRGNRETGWELPQRFEKKQKIQKDVALSLVEVKENGKQIKLEEAFKNKLEKVKVPSIHQEIIRYKKMCELKKSIQKIMFRRTILDKRTKIII